MRLYFIFKQAPRRKVGAALSIAMDRLFGLLTVVFLASVSFYLRFSWLTRASPSRHIAFLAFILLSASLAFVVVLFWLVNSGLQHQLPKRTPFQKAIVKSGEALLCYRTHLGHSHSQAEPHRCQRPDYEHPSRAICKLHPERRRG
jgi:hypothetical protein